MNIGKTILLFALATTACHGEQQKPGPAVLGDRPVSAPPAIDLHAELQVRFDETVSFHDLELRLLEISDSRCPTGVTCVWAGEARVTLQVSRVTHTGKETVELQINLNGRGKPATATSFGYVIEILDVDPYPKNEVTPARSDYLVKIGIADAAAVRSKLSTDHAGSAAGRG